MKLSKIKTFTKKYAYVIIIISLIFIGICVGVSVYFARRSKNSENWNTAADAQRRYDYETQIKNEIRKSFRKNFNFFNKTESPKTAQASR